MKQAGWWMPDTGNNVRCTLCPKTCLIGEGETGFCCVRKNTGGVLYSLAYGIPAALQVDPITKKPLRHYLPGTKTFSVGSFGCNLGCVFCQNHQLSRGEYTETVTRRLHYYEPQRLVDLAKQHSCRSLCFTYNEPSIWAEYVIETFRLAKEQGLGTVLVTNGYIQPDAARELYALTDAANIDIKGCSAEFYHRMCAGTLEPVLTACEILKNELGRHLEITNLVIPGKNDSPEMTDALLDWIESHLDRDIPIHFSAYFPAYRYNESPRTPPGLIREICAHAVERGFTRVYSGNI